MGFPLGIYAILAAVLIVTPVGAEERQIVVIGQGSVSAQPDVGAVTAGVVSVAATAALAMQENADVMSKVLEAAQKAGIADKDVRTSTLNLHPQYRNRSSGSKPEIDGYQATNSVTLTVRDISAVGAVLDAVSKAGANTIGNIGFSVQSPEPLLNKAREAAVLDARAKAELYARAADVELGEVLLIEEAGGGGSPVYPMAREAAMAASTPVRIGETAVNAQVRMVFGIND